MPSWGRLAIAAMVIGAIAIAINSQRTWVVSLSGVQVERHDQPTLYWVLITVHIVLALFLVGLAMPADWSAAHLLSR